MAKDLSPSEAAKELFERWSAKDADAVAELLSEDVEVYGPILPGGHVTGPKAARDYLAMQNGDVSHLPPDERDRHRAMASSRVKFSKVVESGNSAAVEVTVEPSGGGEPVRAAVFVEVGAGKLTSVAIYFHAKPFS